MLFPFPYPSGKLLFCAEDARSELKGDVFQVIDYLIEEITRRLLANSSLLESLEVADHGCDRFLDFDEVLRFCTTFQRFRFDTESLRCRVSVAKNLLGNDRIKEASDVYKCLLGMKSAFPDLLKYYSLVLSLPVSNASCECSFSSLKRIKTC